MGVKSHQRQGMRPLLVRLQLEKREGPNLYIMWPYGKEEKGISSKKTALYKEASGGMLRKKTENRRGWKVNGGKKIWRKKNASFSPKTQAFPSDKSPTIPPVKAAYLRWTIKRTGGWVNR